MKHLFSFILPLGLIFTACSGQTPTITALPEKCTAMTARAAYSFFDHADQGTALLAACSNNDWRLVLKADWASTILDIKWQAGKLQQLPTAIAPLPSNTVKELGAQLTARLANYDNSPLNLATSAVTIKMDIINQKDLGVEQITRLFQEP